MNVVDDLGRWRELRPKLDGSIGFVPTMGALHDGHASLLRRARADNDVVVASIYVNPTQFDQAADLAAYPVSLDVDLARLAELGADYLLLPRYEQIYADGYRFRIDETELSRQLCGAHRAGHFGGVLTVVMKLLNLVRPARAYFGEKDYQQYLLVRDMAAAFFLDTAIVACPTVREADGLALSSRNVRLDAAARCRAPLLYRTLCLDIADEDVRTRLTAAGFDVDYVVTQQGRRFAAVRLSTRDGTVRLIDNVARAA
jgi:pantoate--beta-alanine ligase